MRRRNTTQKKGRSIRVDFSKAGEGFFTPPEDNYAVEITKVEEGESQSGNDQLTMDFKILEGPHKDKNFRHWFSLVDQALWKLAGVLRSAGIKLPKEPADLDLDDIEGRKLMVTINHREWEGKIKTDIADSTPLEEVVTKANGHGEEVKEQGEAISADEINELSSEEEMEEIIEEYQLDLDLSAAKTMRRKKALLIDALEGAGLLAQ